MSTHNAYRESRRHELRKTRLVMIDGNLAVNARSVDGGASERVHDAGYWGFAAASGSAGAGGTLRDKALANARAMARFGARTALSLPGGSYRGEHVFRGKAPLDARACIDRLTALHAHCKASYPDLTSTAFTMHEEHHAKQLETSGGASVVNHIQRAVLMMTLVAAGADGAPVEITERISGKGTFADLDLDIDILAPLLDRTHAHLQAKRHAVAARGGRHVVVLGPALAGILAHEAMGHPCEADLVLGGAVTGDLVGQRVASDLVTMIDHAHTVDGAEAMVPVYADDEGTPAADVVLIERGILRDFMSSRETAAKLGIAPSGSARAYLPSDEPLVRMRNTGIRPGTSRLDELIGGVESGYLLLATGNGQADSTTEFMFGVNLGYEIERGRLGRAIRDTTVSGSAIEVLQSVDAVSDDNVWSSAGYCGKKQPMVVSMGGPAIRARAHLGGA